MNKSKLIREIINLLVVGLRHKIGSIVNSNEFYSQKYAKDSEILIKQAQNLSSNIHFNSYDINDIRNNLKSKLKIELESKEFLDKRKFDLIDSEIANVFKLLKLDN